MGSRSTRIYIDIETTGLDPATAVVVEVGAVALTHKGAEVETFSSLVNPGEEALRNASPEAMRSHGIPEDEILAAPAAPIVAASLQEFLDRHPDASLHAFNRAFEIGFLRLSPWTLSRHFSECVMEAASEIMRRARATGSRPDGSARYVSLDRAAAFFRVPLDPRHRGLSDARAAAGIHTKIVLGRESEAMDEARNVMDRGF